MLLEIRRSGGDQVTIAGMSRITVSNNVNAQLFRHGAQARLLLLGASTSMQRCIIVRTTLILHPVQLSWTPHVGTLGDLGRIPMSPLMSLPSPHNPHAKACVRTSRWNVAWLAHKQRQR
ncbi:unnamed protein product [Cercospora beticola]|nr:unnamed protein product [Cercospora beticola]